MSDLHLLQGMGTARGMDEGQNANLTRVLAAQYDTTDGFKKEIAAKKIGRPEMLDYTSGNGFGKAYLMGGYFTQEDNKKKFSTPESTYLYLDSITKGSNPLLKPNKQQLEKASGVLNAFDTPEKVRQVQAALGLDIDGVVGNDTKRAAANFLSVYNEKEFKSKVNGALSAPRNYATVLEAFRAAESGTQTFAEGALHIGQETLNKNNNAGKGIANTTRYGVVEKDWRDSGNRLNKGFPRKANESDYDHALRFYKDRVLPNVEKVKGIKDESQDVVTALASLAWNRGSLPSGLDLKNEEKSRKALLTVTTTGGKHSNGVANRSIQGYEQIGKAKGWGTIASVKTVADSKSPQKFHMEFFDSNGTLLYKDSTVAEAAAQTSIKPNYQYTVTNGVIQTQNGTLLSVK